MFRHKSITQCFVNAVSSCIQAVPARSSDSLHELTNFTFRIFGKCVNNCVCQLACLCLVSWTIPRRMEHRLTLLRKSTLLSSCASQLAHLQVVPPRRSVCRWVRQGSLPEKLKRFRNPLRRTPKRLDIWKTQSVAPCLTWMLLAWDIKCAAVLRALPQLAHGSFYFPSKNRRWTLWDSAVGESSNSVIMPTSKPLTCTVASCVDSALPLAFVMTVGSCDRQMVPPPTRKWVHSCGEMCRCLQ